MSRYSSDEYDYKVIKNTIRSQRYEELFNKYIAKNNISPSYIARERSRYGLMKGQLTAERRAKMTPEQLNIFYKRELDIARGSYQRRRDKAYLDNYLKGLAKMDAPAGLKKHLREVYNKVKNKPKVRTELLNRLPNLATFLGYVDEDMKIPMLDFDSYMLLETELLRFDKKQYKNPLEIEATKNLEEWFNTTRARRKQGKAYIFKGRNKD